MKYCILDVDQPTINQS